MTPAERISKSPTERDMARPVPPERAHTRAGGGPLMPAGETEPGATPLVADFTRLFETLAAKMRPPAVGAGEGRGHLLPWLGRQLWPGMAEQVARGSFPLSYRISSRIPPYDQPHDTKTC